MLINLKCSHCGHEDVTESPCPFTGWEYHQGWVLRCAECGSDMNQRQTVRHISRCEEVLGKVENTPYPEELPPTCENCSHWKDYLIRYDEAGQKAGDGFCAEIIRRLHFHNGAFRTQYFFGCIFFNQKGDDALT